MQYVPANACQTAVWPVSLQNQPDVRSISDDDLCAWCRYLCYRPGELSLCLLSVTNGIWPSLVDVDGYAQSCQQMCLNASPAELTRR